MHSHLTYDDVYSILRSDEEFMNILRSIAAVFDGPWCVFGGQVRNKIWDVASKSSHSHASTDIDIGIFIPHDITIETTLATSLSSSSVHLNWDVENFGISHTRNHDERFFAFARTYFGAKS